MINFLARLEAYIYTAIKTEKFLLSNFYKCKKKVELDSVKN